MKIFRAINTCFQIYSYASLFAPTDEYRYKYIDRRELKRELGLTQVEDHHLIPKSLKNHPLLYDFDVNQCKNIISSKIIGNENISISIEEVLSSK